jgi:hypothetical protein
MGYFENAKALSAFIFKNHTKLPFLFEIRSNLPYGIENNLNKQSSRLTKLIEINVLPKPDWDKFKSLGLLWLKSQLHAKRPKIRLSHPQ